MTRTFTDDNDTVLDDELVDDQDDNQTDDVADDNDEPEDDEQDADDATADADDNEPTQTAQQVWDNAVAGVKAGDHIDPAQFAADFASTGEKDAHEKLNELNNSTASQVYQDPDIDMADKGMILGGLAMLVEAVHAILPDKKVSKGSTVDPKAVALDNAKRLYAVRNRVDNLRDDIDRQLREQAVVAGLVTTDELQEMDDNGDDAFEALALDTSKVTFTKKFGESLDYIAGVPGKAKGTGAGAGEPFSPGQVRFDNKGNSIRFDGTHYFVTLKGAGENPTKFTSSSTAAKKLITDGTEVNGLKHFRHHSDPTA